MTRIREAAVAWLGIGLFAFLVGGCLELSSRAAGDARYSDEDTGLSAIYGPDDVLGGPP